MYFNSLFISSLTPEKVAIKLAGECKCDKCNHGCKYGAGAFKKGEEKKLAKFLKLNEKELKDKYLEEIELFNTKLLRPKILKEQGKPYGKCVFFDDEKNICKVHKAKPLQCKIASGHAHGEQMHTWFILNHFVNPDDPESIRQYAEYLKHNKTIPGGALLELVPNKIKLRKIINYEILR